MYITTSKAMAMYHEYEFYANENELGERTKEELEDIKKNDKGYRKIKQRLNKEWNGKFHKNATIEFYISGDTGSHIRDAVTGKYYNHEVGSKEEDLYFKVGVSYTVAGPQQGSLFYSSPEEYENHQFVLLSPQIKQNWHHKNLVARKSLLN